AGMPTMARNRSSRGALIAAVALLATGAGVAGVMARRGSDAPSPAREPGRPPAGAPAPGAVRAPAPPTPTTPASPPAVPGTPSPASAPAPSAPAPSALPHAPDPNVALAEQMKSVLASFVTWSRDHAGAACPGAAALGPEVQDPWGHALQI